MRLLRPSENRALALANRAQNAQLLELLECAALLGGSIQADIALTGVLSPGVAGDETVECVERRATGFE